MSTGAANGVVPQGNTSLSPRAGSTPSLLGDTGPPAEFNKLASTGYECWEVKTSERGSRLVGALYGGSLGTGQVHSPPSAH